MPDSTTEQFVIWTRYIRPTGKIVRHVYGPFSTRAKAQTVLRTMKKDLLERYGNDKTIFKNLETQVTKLI